jgi:hypothetical protein
MAMSKFTIQDQEWAEDLEKGVEEYTDQLFEVVFDGEDLGDNDVPTLSGEPFCGCSTCFFREALFYVVPRIINGYKEGKITLDEE